jgi:hypothetical protein
VGAVPRFAKVYREGWHALAGLLDNKAAAKLYLFLAEHCGHDNGLVCTYELLAEETGMSERTIRRAVRYLEDGNHVAALRMGTARCYVLNPEEVWKTYEDHKRFCAFNARALVSKRENANLKRRLTHFLGSQPDLLDEAA